MEKVPYLALDAIIVGVSMHGRGSAGRLISMSEFGWGARLAQAVYGAVFYIEKTFVPAGLITIYEVPLSQFSLFGSRCLIATAAFIGLTAFVWAKRKVWPSGLVGWLCYLALLLPVSGLAKYDILWQIAANKWSYLPALVPPIFVGAGVLRLGEFFVGRNGGFRRIAAGTWAPILALSALGVLTWRESKMWKDPEELWTHAVSIDPDCELCHKALSFILIDKGRYQESISHSLERLRFTPEGDVETFINMCRAYGALGQMDQVAACRPRYSNHPELGIKYAERDFQKALDLSREGRWNEAITRVRMAMAVAPDYLGRANVHYSLAVFLQQNGQAVESEKEYKEALRLDPSMGNAHLNLGVLFTSQGRIREAVAHCRKARQLNPGMPNNPYCRGS